MSVLSELKTWSWIVKIWIPLYSLLLIIGVVIGTYFEPEFYWSVVVFGVPLVVIPRTYKNLVGGGCSLRFQMCALVKGMLAGFVFLFLSLLTDSLIWQTLSLVVGWSPLSLGISQDTYFIWFFSGVIGGFAARVIEVKGRTNPVKITIAGFE
ncbi:hypothetical protein EU527_19645 [Candidatus Thorarchaeota archaeon]|nr:MAG: hypothetical protein EU527_19645 [Candidatus Thorarchaeota archaeon]